MASEICSKVEKVLESNRVVSYDFPLVVLHTI